MRTVCQWLPLVLVGCDGLPGGDWDESGCPGAEEEYAERRLDAVPAELDFGPSGAIRLADVQAAFAGYLGCGTFDRDDLRTLDRIEVRIPDTLDLAGLPGTAYFACEALDWVRLDEVPVAIRIFGTRNQSLSLEGHLRVSPWSTSLQVGASCDDWAAPPCDLGAGWVVLAIEKDAQGWALSPPGSTAERTTTRLERAPCDAGNPQPANSP